MEVVILTCLQAQILIGRTVKTDLPIQIRNDIVLEIKEFAPKECKLE